METPASGSAGAWVDLTLHTRGFAFLLKGWPRGLCGIRTEIHPLGVRVDIQERPGGRLVQARFDERVPTHSAEQWFQLDAQHRLLRHDDTADVMGSWALAANLCWAYERVQGQLLYTRRQVVPTLGLNRRLPFPTFVSLQPSDIRILSAG